MSQDPTSVRTETDGSVVAGIIGDADTNRVAVDSSGRLSIDVTQVTAEPLDVSAAEVDVDINSQTLGQVTTTLDDSLQANALDQVRVDLQNNNAGTLATEQQTPIQVENSSGTVKDVLGSGDQPLDVSAATVTVDQPTHDNFNANANLQVGDTDVSDTNPVPVDTETSGATTNANYKATASLSAQTSETLSFAISSNNTEEIQKATVSAEVPFKAEIQTYNGTSATTVGIIHGEAGTTEIFEPNTSSTAFFQQQNTASGEEFRVVCTNNNASGIGDSASINVTFESEVV